MNIAHRADAFGRSPDAMDRLEHDIHEIVQRPIKRHRYAHDFMGMRRAIRILGSWEASQTGAGGWGDLYADLALPEAMDRARECWAEIRAEMRCEA